jgi:hypothetical protein
MLTHGSGCQRAWSGPFVALVGISEVQGKRRGIGTLPTAPSGILHLAERCYQIPNGFFHLSRTPTQTNQVVPYPGGVARRRLL